MGAGRRNDSRRRARAGGMVAVEGPGEDRREGRRLSVHPSRGLRVQADHQLLEIRGLASDPAGGARRGVEQQRDRSRPLPQVAGTGRRISGAAAAVEGFEGLDGAGGLGRELDPDGELVVAQGDLAVVVRRGVQVPRPPLPPIFVLLQTLRRAR